MTGTVRIRDGWEGHAKPRPEASEHGGPHVLDASAQKEAWRHPEGGVLHVCTVACILEEACISYQREDAS